MKRVILKPLQHRNKNCIGIYFQYNEELKDIVKKIPGSKWSQTHKCFYVIHSTDNKKKVYYLLRKANCYVDYSRMIKAKEKKRKSKYQASHLSASHQQSLEKYERYLSGHRKSKSTIRTYSNFIEKFLSFYNEKSLEEIDNRSVEIFVEDVLAKFNYSISAHRQCINALKHFSELELGSSYNPAEIAMPKKAKKLPTVLSTGEIIKLMQVTKNIKHRTIIGLLYSSGLRIGELLNLTLASIDFDRNTIYVKSGKGKKDRNCSLGQSIRPLLVNYVQTYQPEQYLFEGKSGSKYADSSVRAFLKRNCKAAGILKPVTPHTLRHSYATHLLENGVDVRYIQELLGHSRPETTMIYTHVTERNINEIQNPLDIAVNRYKQLDKQHKNISLSRKNNK
ncbi:MAG: site-specific tyrosine recombinase/integron integrase [Bacteroidota bacterium]